MKILAPTPRIAKAASITSAVASLPTHSCTLSKHIKSANEPENSPDLPIPAKQRHPPPPTCQPCTARSFQARTKKNKTPNHHQSSSAHLSISTMNQKKQNQKKTPHSTVASPPSLVPNMTTEHHSQHSTANHNTAQHFSPPLSYPLLRQSSRYEKEA